MAQASQCGLGPLDGLANDLNTKTSQTRYLSTNLRLSKHAIAKQRWHDAFSSLMRPKTYQHMRINAKHEFRLLDLHRGNIGEPLECSVMKVSLDDWKQPYTALSHAWGTENKGGEIWIRNSVPFQGPRKLRLVIQHVIRYRKQLTFAVRPNLYSALKRLRQPDQDLYLWVDALCIDRDDLLELNMQVQLMANIYQRAEKVHVWLGEGNGNSDAAFDLIDQNLDPIKDFTLDQRGQMLELMRNRWFTRLWNVQELALARNASIQCGTRSITWIEFAEYVARFNSNFDVLGDSLGLGWETRLYQSSYLRDLRGSEASFFVESIPKLFKRSKDGDITEALFGIESLVSSLSGLKVSDPRDTIYALLSIARDTRKVKEDDSKGVVLRPDYGKDYTDVCIEFASFCIHTSGSLDIICRPWALDLALPLPSWIPLLKKAPFGLIDSIQKGRVNGEGLVGTPGSGSYNACGGIRASERFEPRFKVNPSTASIPSLTTTSRAFAQHIHARSVRRSVVTQDFIFAEESRGRKRQPVQSRSIYVKGYRVDSVGSVSARVVAGVVPREFMQLCIPSEFDGEEITKIPEEFWRTLVADRNAKGGPPPAWYEKACLESLAHVNGNGDLDTAAIIANRGSPLVTQYLERVQSVVWNRRLSRLTYTGRLGLLPVDAEPGDSICILLGCSVPVVLRPDDFEDPSHFVLIGECYVHGIMNGEALDKFDEGYDGWNEYEIR